MANQREEWEVYQRPPKRTAWQQYQLGIINAVYTGRANKLLDDAREQAARRGDAITVVCLSDTHNYQVPYVPEGDLLIHAGDLTTNGTLEELNAQIQWLKTLPHPHKVVIAGNHDRCLNQSSRIDVNNLAESSGDPCRHITYLQDESVTLSFDNGRTLTVYGSPYTPKFKDFAFQYPRQEDYWLNKVPGGADIVAVHGPPICHLDRNAHGSPVGCHSLLKELRRVRPRLVVFGHIHEGYGEEVVAWDDLQTVWERQSLARGNMLDLATALKASAFGHPVYSISRDTHLINASSFQGLQKERKPPLVLKL